MGMFDTYTKFEFEDFAFKDTVKTIAVAILLAGVMYFTLQWLTTNVEGQIRNTFILYTIVVLWIGAYFLNILKSRFTGLKTIPFGTVGLGTDLKAVSLLTLLALVLGYFLVAQNLTITLPSNITFSAEEGEFVYNVMFAPIVEEMFRAVVMLSVGLLAFALVLKQSKSWFLALLIGLFASSIMFGILHLLVYQADFTAIGASVVFGLLAGLLMLMSKSILPAVGLHFANNVMLHTEGDPLILIVVSAFVFAVFIYSFFRRS